MPGEASAELGAEAFATKTLPAVPLGPDGDPPIGEALERARQVVSEARSALGGGPAPGLAASLFGPELDHYGPALDLRGQFCALGIQPEGQPRNPDGWYRRAKAYGFMPALPEQASGWRYARLAAYGLGGEVMNTDPEPGRAAPAERAPR